MVRRVAEELVGEISIKIHAYLRSFFSLSFIWARLVIEVLMPAMAPPWFQLNISYNLEVYIRRYFVQNFYIKNLANAGRTFRLALFFLLLCTRGAHKNAGTHKNQFISGDYVAWEPCWQILVFCSLAHWTCKYLHQPLSENHLGSVHKREPESTARATQQSVAIKIEAVRSIHQQKMNHIYATITLTQLIFNIHQYTKRHAVLQTKAITHGCQWWGGQWAP